MDTLESIKGSYLKYLKQAKKTGCLSESRSSFSKEVLDTSATTTDENSPTRPKNIEPISFFEQSQEIQGANLLDNQLKLYDKKYRSHSSRRTRSITSSSRRSNRKEKKNIYKWMPVRGHSAALTQKVKSKLIELLGDVIIPLFIYFSFFQNTNRRKLEKTVEKFKADNKEKGSLIYDYRIHLQNQSIDSSKKKNHQELVDNMPGYALKLMNIKARKFGIRHTINSVNTKKRTKSVDISWNTEIEKEYGNSIERGRKELWQKRKGQKLESLGFYPIFFKFWKEENFTNLRKTLFDKFRDGQPLSSSEYKYLALTSEVLNAHLDQQEYKEYLSVLDPDFVADVEMALASEILEGYYSVLRELKEARGKYFRREMCRKKRSILNTPLKKIGTNKRDLLDKRLREIYNREVKKYLKDKQSVLDAKKRYLGYWSQQKLFFERNLCKAQRARSVDRRARHPHSKILRKYPEPKHNFLSREQKIKIKKEETVYRRKREDGYIISKRSFLKTYSNGPLSFQKHNRHIKEQAAIVIQRCWKGYQARSKYRNTIKYIVSKKQKKGFKTMRKMMMRKRIINSLQQSSNKQEETPKSSKTVKEHKYLLNTESKQRNMVNEKGLKILELCKNNDYFHLNNLGEVILKRDTKVCDEQGNTGLHFACHNSNFKIVEILIEAGANPNTPNIDELTPCDFVEDQNLQKYLFQKGGYF